MESASQTVRSARPRIALISLHWEFFDSIMPATFRAEKEAVSARVAEFLGLHAKVAHSSFLTGEAEAAKLLRILRDDPPDAIVVFVHMATPGSYPWTVLQSLDVPLLIWNAHMDQEVPRDFDMAELCRRSSNVGSLMLTNVLCRNGRSFEIVTAPFDDAAARDRIAVFLRSAHVASRIRSGRIGLLGGPMDGYLDVEIEASNLESSLGTRIVPCSLQEWKSHLDSVDDVMTEAEAAVCRDRFESVEMENGELSRSVRVALALERWMDALDLDAAAINCHTEYLRFSEDAGIAACLGASRQTTNGRPVACTGDIPTAIAMWIGKAFGAPVLYCECDAIDYAKGTMVMANTGECDYGLCKPGGRVKICPNEHFGPGGKNGQGACHFVPMASGPATLLGFSPNSTAKGGWILIAASGRIEGTFHDKLLAGNCEFRFTRQPVAAAFDSWAKAGATHHGALALGDITREIRDLADMLGIEAAIIE